MAKGEIDVAESYYRKDAELLNIAYRPNGVNIKELSKRESNFILFPWGTKSEQKKRFIIG